MDEAEESEFEILDLDEAEEPEYDSADSAEDFMTWKDKCKKEAEERWAAWLEPGKEADEDPICTVKQIDKNANDSVTCDREGQIEDPEKGYEAEEPEYDSTDFDEDFMSWKNRVKKEAEERWAAWLEPRNEADEEGQSETN